MGLRLQYELNRVRLTLLVAMLFTGLAATVFRTPPILFMAALLWSAPLVGILIGSLASRNLRLERTLPERGSVGDVVDGQIHIENASFWPTFMVHIRAGEPGISEGWRQWLGKRRNDTAGGHDSAMMAIGGDEHVTPLLRPGERERWDQQWLLLKRGVHTLPAARAGALDPAGLFTRLDVKTPPHQIMVLPSVVRIDRLGFQGGSTEGQFVPRHAVQVADAMDFHGIRPWQQGEPIRRVHWKATARTGTLQVVEWEDDVSTDVAILLDARVTTIAGDFLDNTLEAAITLAGSIATHLLEMGCMVQFFCWSDSPEVSEPQPTHLSGHNLNNLAPFLEGLARIDVVTDERCNLTALAHAAGPHIPAGQCVVLLGSTLADVGDAARAVEASTGGRCPCHALVLDALSFSVPLSRGDRQPWSAPAGGGRLNLGRIATRTVRRGDSLAAALERPFGGG